MCRTAKKILLPHLVVTETAYGGDPQAMPVAIQAPGPLLGKQYHVRPVLSHFDGHRKDGLPGLRKLQFNLFPVVVDGDGVPWAEATLYLLARLEDKIFPSMSTYAGMADDLAAYRRFLDETGVDWTCFPSQKLSRPTYRFNAYLKFSVSAGEISLTTARRRMGTVIGFYRWLQEDSLVLENPPWKERDVYIDICDSKGVIRPKKVITTDVSIKGKKQEDQFGETIDDGGKLRPLPQKEQEWLLDALFSLGNTEMTLIHLVALLTGARIQTVLTFRLRHVLKELDPKIQEDVRMPIGPGTGIDTKNDKRMVLHLPVWLYHLLYTYGQSDRAIKRRNRATGGDHENQHLFLSAQGSPMYQTKDATNVFDELNQRRHAKNGQVVRQFITDRVIPFVQAKYGSKEFRYRFHDIRATAGMNWTDHQLKLVEAGEITLADAREFVKVRMGHDSAATTDRYLQYRRNLKMVRWAIGGYEQRIQELANRSLKGMI